MWFSAPVFETFTAGVKDVYDVFCDGKEEDTQEDDCTLMVGLKEDLNLKKVSNLQSFWNIFNANQGVVILSMPFVVLSGTYMSLIFTAIIAVISNYTSKRLIKCLYEKDEETNIEIRVRNSYEDIGEAFGGQFGKWMVYAAMIVEQLSYCTLLLILCGSILHSSFPDSALKKHHWSMIAFLLVIPNAFMMNLGQVAFVSLLTVIIGQIVYLTVAVYSFYRSNHWTFKETPDWDVGNFFISMGIVVVSYSSQPYMPAIEGSMKKKKHYPLVMDVTYFMITLVKILFGLIGYLTFKGDTKQVITNNLPHGPFKITVNIGVFMLALFSFTFPAYTVFVLIDKMRFSKKWMKKLNQLNKKEREENECFVGNDCDADMTESRESTSLMTSEEDDEESVAPDPYTLISRLKRAFIRLILISIALSIAIVVPHFGLYMSFIGNFTGMCLAFIFPCLFHVKLRQLDTAEIMIHTLIILFGSVSAGAGMYYSTKAIVDAYSQAD